MNPKNKTPTISVKKSDVMRERLNTTALDKRMT